MANNYNVPNVTVNADTPDEPSPGLVNFANNLGIDEDQLKTVYTGLKQSNPDLPDAKIALALKYYSQQPQQQLQTGMNRQQDVQNALPSAADIKAANDPAVAQQYGQFLKDNGPAMNLSQANAVAADARGLRDGSVQKLNGDMWQRDADQILKPAELGANIQKNQMDRLGDLRGQLQTGIQNLMTNTNAQVQFATLDPTSQISQTVVGQMVKMGVMPANAIGKVSAAQVQMLFQDKDKSLNSSVQGIINDAQKAHAETITANAAAANAGTNRQKQNFVENQVNQHPNDVDISSGEVSTSEGKKAVEKSDADAYATAAKSFVPASNTLNTIDQAMALVKNAYTGPGGALLAKIPDSQQQKLDAALSSVFTNRLTSATASGLSAGAERLEGLQNAFKAATGSIGQGPQTLLQNLQRARDEVANTVRDNQARVAYYRKNHSFDGYEDTAPKPIYTGGKKPVSSSVPSGWAVQEH
jgi:hypothetical protein